MLNVRLSDELDARLTHLAGVTKRSKSFYVREAIERSLEDIEDIYLAEAALERFKVSGAEAIPLEEVRRGLALGN